MQKVQTRHFQIRQNKMKTLKISDEAHRKLTGTVGTLMAQTGKMQTYQDAIEAMVPQVK